MLRLGLIVKYARVFVLSARGHIGITFVVCDSMCVCIYLSVGMCVCSKNVKSKHKRSLNLHTVMFFFFFFCFSLGEDYNQIECPSENGECLYDIQVCNIIPDCSDGSDEGSHCVSKCHLLSKTKLTPSHIDESGVLFYDFLFLFIFLFSF